MTEGAPDDADDWSVRANYWRGDRALGGRLEVTEDRIRFRPHGLERSLGGQDVVDVNFSELRSLLKAPRSLKVPRLRLILRTEDTDHYFLVPNLDSVINRLESATGQSVQQDRGGGATEGPGRPEQRPDDSLAMNLIYSGWLHLGALVILAVFSVVLLSVNDRPPVWSIGLGVLISFEAWMTIRSFQRTTRVRAQRRGRGF